MKKEAQDYIRKMTNPFLFRFGMLVRLPSVVFWGVSIKSLTNEFCEVTIPYAWRSQNPFKSIYFAALAGAAELSTGALCQVALAGRGSISMLVIDFRAEYFKKASERITFRCDQGKEVEQLIENLSIQEDKTGTLQMISTGQNQKGETVAKFYITWSFKIK
ncbi:MAG: DUF4442 domain-containing protein [Saprospiraceae bacterium]|nr:DUF4442 domain-containing protein [Saprospiraceae bacterium]